jgi:hypothetical protein
MTKTAQPKWRCIANLGDVNPLDHGGLFLYRDTTGQYDEEMEKIELGDEDPEKGDEYLVFRVVLDRCQVVLAEPDEAVDLCLAERFDPAMAKTPNYTRHHFGYLVDYALGSSVGGLDNLPHPLRAYDEWFHRDLHKVAESLGNETTYLGLVQAFCSPDAMQRAWAYQAVADHYGWDNFDSCPLTLTKKEARKRVPRRWR